MCGIAGIFALAGDPVDARVARTMADVLRHRGPDSAGAWSDGPIAFGHNRLRIIDTSDAGRQPMPNEDETVWLNYNGETYNYRELRPELERTGHRFHSATDTEVLVHGYEEWGDAFLQRLNGMFAFALWDAPRRRLLLARDRLGVKPLYLAQRDGLLLFASEIKALLAALPTAPAPDARAIADYVGLDYVDHSDRTFFTGITQLLPGHLLVAENGRMRVERWWDVPSPNAIVAGTEAEQQFRSLFEDSVRLRLRSDVPLGSCLSGGLDSSAVVGEVSALLEQGRETDAVGHALRTFSAVFPGEAFDESRFVDAVVDANTVEPQPTRRGAAHPHRLEAGATFDAVRPEIHQPDADLDRIGPVHARRDEGVGQVR